MRISDWSSDVFSSDLPRDRQLPERPGAVRLEEDLLRAEHREGDQAPRRCRLEAGLRRHSGEGRRQAEIRLPDLEQPAAPEDPGHHQAGLPRSEEHTSELQSLMRISYAVFCLKKKRLSINQESC